jgi:hypothetical protein
MDVQAPRTEPNRAVAHSLGPIGLSKDSIADDAQSLADVYILVEFASGKTTQGSQGQGRRL